ncbi:molybdenum cofactor guanylyltransferase [Marinomonas pollencensis]|uniref:Molybdenum cofactor guanylyltransferase n=1 Tax=Marinomonas pollencensis TaxID=491954 RepID=A0A3E0DMV4_9GAMM|nr:NTP transferase domain-containing protein [Marinomonas pollencensis]REG84160.1 molybdenum cofactor guanylyltransferase [Marinomonas pollencensis]
MACSFSGVVLAGGRAQRMDGVEKGLMLYQGKPMIARVAQAMEGLTKSIVLNVNRQFRDYQELGYPLLHDADEYAERGPLSGLWSALSQASCGHLLVAPCDTPNISSAAFAALLEASQSRPEQIHCLASASGIHPLHAIIPVESALLCLTNRLAESSQNSVLGFYRQHGFAELLWHHEDELLNVNYHDQLTRS